MIPEVHATDLPWLTTEQMVEVDRVMIEDLGIALIQMMENAGRNLAELALERFEPESVAVLAGTGGNGGGVLAAARHLVNRGVDVTVTVTEVGRLREIPRLQFDALVAMGVSVADEPPGADLMLDGVIGYSLSGSPHGRAADLIAATRDRLVLSLDAPSGLDTATGAADGAVQAWATLTLAAPKVGLYRHLSVGELYLGDISVPPFVYRTLGFESLAGLGVAPLVRIVGV